ncbi:hypothetical protein H5410_040165 [Solanum commersonii]|uniref:Uncharacterized protein n=1 Tax=Solanum commersonii TaxID=4109 RepID=A0A9J5XN39_SOLCO|nr:hypothetical protein H5410_040165 [Solanum commersonii]
MCCKGPVGALSWDCRSTRRPALWSIPSPFCFGQSSTASRNYSVTHRLLLSIPDLIFSFRAWHTGTLGKIMVIWQLAQWVRRSSGLLFFCQCFIPQSKYLENQGFTSVIGTTYVFESTISIKIKP